MDVDSYDYPILSPVVPLAGVDGHYVRDRELGPKLEVVDTN
jgi:hypothetical protein